MDKRHEFPGFRALNSSAALKAVASHWNDARRDRLIPDWANIRPLAMAGQLSTSDGATGDGIIGATEYKAIRDDSADLHTEAEFWFSL